MGDAREGFQPDTYYFLVSDERKLSLHFEKRDPSVQITKKALQRGLQGFFCDLY
jgi:hypothetical protein